MQDVPRDPVLAPDGHTYERSALENWLRQHPRISFISGKRMRAALVQNRTSQTIIENLFSATGASA